MNTTYLIRNPKTGEFFSDPKDCWVRDVICATKFGTKSNAENAVKVNGLRGAEIIDADAEARATVA